MCILGAVFGCVDPIITIACVLGYRNPFVIPIDNAAKKASDSVRLSLSGGSNSDHITCASAVASYMKNARGHRTESLMSFCKSPSLLRQCE